MKKLVIAIICIPLVIASCSKKTSPSAAIDGASLFSGNCAKCHGADGATGRAPNLVKLDIGTAEISDIVSNGKGRMPQFADKLSAKEISAVAQFVFKLRK